MAGDLGAGQIADAAFDEGGGHTGLFFAPVGRSVADGIVRFDGTKSEWTREPVKLPLGSEAKFHILAIDATGLGNAWAIAEAADSLNRAVVLLQRTSTPEGPAWVEKGLGAAQFADRETPALGISGLAPIGGAAQPLTTSADGVWIDLSGTIAGVARDVTVFYDIGSGAVAGAWCDAATVCGTNTLGVKFSRQIGYRSFAWPGDGPGTRIVTNPLDAEGGEESNRGTYLRLSAGAFARLPGAGGNFRAGGAFYNDTVGWLDGPVEVSAKVPPDRLHPWPVSLRAPLTAATTAPGTAAGRLSSPALAVGVDGGVARYTPARGWQREFLLSSSGAVRKPILRGVAWPEPGRAYAVGDLGAMWQWNANDDLWIADPGVPIGFEGNLTGIAFDPGDPSRGFAVGKDGVLLRFGKSWEQDPLPAGFSARSFTSIAFAGSEAIAAAGDDLLVEGGGGWHVDASAHALLRNAPGAQPYIYAVAGLPDGGAVAAGRDIVIERDGGPGSPWRYSKQPIPGSTAIAAAAVRSGGSVRAVVSVIPQLSFPPADDLPAPDPNLPPPVLPPFALPGDGYLLRETANGWEDEQRTSFASSGADRPLKSDPVLALLLDSSGVGWALGGWSGHADAGGRGTSAAGSGGSSVRARVRTASIARYADGTPAPHAAVARAVPMPPGPIRLAVAGHAECEETCAELTRQALGADRTLTAALQTVAGFAGGHGPRALLYTGNRVATGLGLADGERYASLLGSTASLPVYAALGSDDVAESAGSSVFQLFVLRFSGPVRHRCHPGRRLDRGHARGRLGGRCPHPLRLRQQRPRRHGAGDRSRQFARVPGCKRSVPEPAGGTAALAGSGARRRSRQGHSDDRDGQPQSQSELHAETERRERRHRGRAGSGRRRRLGIRLRSAGREPDDADPGRRGDDDPQLRHRHPGLPFAAGRGGRRQLRRLPLRRQRCDGARARRRRPRPEHQPGTGGGSADPGDPGPLA